MECCQCRAECRWCVRQVASLGSALGDGFLPWQLEGQGDLVSRLTMGIVRVTIWIMWLLPCLLSPTNPTP